MKTTRKLSLFALATAVLPSLALAHPGHDGHELTWDFTGGFSHPWGGWDHVMAMICIGLWAMQLGGRARWLIPSAFVTVMAAAAVFGRSVGVIPGLEQGIAASILALGLLIASAKRLPVGIGMALVGFFAIFHGLAHGAEMAASTGALSYGAGFILATIALHLVGLGLGFALKNRPSAIRFAGGAAAVAGAIAFVA